MWGVETRTHRVLAGIVALLALLALTVLCIWLVRPPSPAGGGAPAAEFSAARAYAHVQRLGTQMHVAGSPAADGVRDYIEQTLRSYGLQPEIQDAIGADADGFGEGYTMARVRNVIAVLPGTASTGRVFLTAHYDSVQVSYGANDDGAGVATLLETVRALKAGPAPKNDLVFVFTDAEEACLCGAEAFVSQSPLAQDGGVVLNFEARGSGGPAIMFETSRNNAGVVGVYGDAVPYPVATSFAAEVYRILPNDTDFSPFRDTRRFTGLNTAYIDGSAVYHSPQDRPEYIDRASLQHHGANALALAHAFGDGDIAKLGRESGGDSTYFPVLGQLVRYPGWLVWPLAVLALAGVAYLAVEVRRRFRLSWRRLAAAFGLGLIPILVAPILAQLYWLLLVAIRPGYRQMIDPWRPGWFRDAVVLLVAAVVLGWYALLRKRFSPWALTVGALGWLAVLALVLAAATPGGSYLAALPALAGAVAAIVALRLPHPWWRALALGLGGAIAVLVLAPTVALFFPALGLATGAAAALFATMLGLAILPLLEHMFRSWVTKFDAPDLPADPNEVPIEPVEVAGDGTLAPRGTRFRNAIPAVVAAALAVAATGIGLGVDRFDQRHPAPEQLMYALDADTGQARWVSADPNPGAWSAQLASGRADLEDAFPMLGDDIAAGPAQPADLLAPLLSVVSDSTDAGRRALTLNLAPQRPVRLVYIRINDAKVISATVAGREVPAESLDVDKFGVLFHAPPAGGVELKLVLDKAGPVTFRVMDGSDGLTALPGFIARPADVGIEGSHTSELALVAKTYTL